MSFKQKMLIQKSLLSKKPVGAIFILVFFALVFVYFYMLTNNKISLFYNDGYQPDQPIPFSHKLHAGEYGMDCRYCHSGVDVGRHSSIPSLNVCMNCHRLVKTDSPWIKKITEAYNENKPIYWEKVHLLPDHVKFSHFHHIKAGKDCRVCHGPVEEMDVVYQHSSLSMGWCVNCHRQAPAEHQQSQHHMSKEQGEIFSTEGEIKVLEDLKPEGHSQAPINCSTCHY